jgi:hypothetical protein
MTSSDTDRRADEEGLRTLAAAACDGDLDGERDSRLGLCGRKGREWGKTGRRQVVCCITCHNRKRDNMETPADDEGDKQSPGAPSTGTTAWRRGDGATYDARTSATGCRPGTLADTCSRRRASASAFSSACRENSRSWVRFTTLRCSTCRSHGTGQATGATRQRDVDRRRRERACFNEIKQTALPVS